MAAESIAIRFAASEQPIIADRLTLQSCSSCARGLPAAADEWDVSGLLIEGGVQRQTVVDYVNAISKLLHNELVIVEEQSERPPATTLARLASLLAFADAVGTIRGLLLALDAESTADSLVAEMLEARVHLGLRGYYHFPNHAPLEVHVTQYSSGSVTENWSHLKLATLNSNEDQVLLCKQLAQQLEAALYLAYKLQLPKLLKVLQSCIQHNSRYSNSVLSTADVLETVLSARVLNAASASSNNDLRQAMTQAYTSELCSFVGGEGYRQLLEPINLTAQQKEPIRFQAKVLEDFYGCSKGQVVSVALDLMEFSKLHIEDSDSCEIDVHSVHLVMGRSLSLMPMST